MTHLVQTARVIVADYDGTCADTFAKSPNGVGVNEASAIAIGRIMGQIGEAAYQAIGGLQNRSPTALIAALLEVADSDKMLDCARCHAARNFDKLIGCVPKDKGAAIDFDTDVLGSTVELYVREKLSVLLGELNRHQQTGWPMPYPGVLEFCRAVQSHRMPFAVLSSGHECFISRWFELWGVVPDVLVTDDDLRGLPGVTPEQRSKPNGYLAEYLLDRLTEHRPWVRMVHPAQILYLGDDAEKDGELAATAGFSFGHFCPGTEGLQQTGRDSFCFGNWHDLLDCLSRRS